MAWYIGFLAGTQILRHLLLSPIYFGLLFLLVSVVRGTFLSDAAGGAQIGVLGFGYSVLIGYVYVGLAYLGFRFLFSRVT